MCVVVRLKGQAGKAPGTEQAVGWYFINIIIEAEAVGIKSKMSPGSWLEYHHNMSRLQVRPLVRAHRRVNL